MEEWVEQGDNDQQTFASLRAGIAAAVMMVAICFAISLALVHNVSKAEATSSHSENSTTDKR